MITKRIKPSMSVTLDGDVLRWLDAEAKRLGMKRSQYAARLLYDAMRAGSESAEAHPTRATGASAKRRCLPARKCRKLTGGGEMEACG
jgi:hypothetical protein